MFEEILANGVSGGYEALGRVIIIIAVIAIAVVVILAYLLFVIIRKLVRMQRDFEGKYDTPPENEEKEEGS